MNVEIFACSGGLAEGFRRAGVHFDLVVDKDPDACDSYAANLGQRPVQIDVHDLLRMVRAGWRPGAIELLTADPPCTPWSRAGKRQGLADDRDCLAETAELIALLRPRAYLIGNIPGLNDAPTWGIVQDVIGGLARHGYCVVDYAILDAASYGVPQRRSRPYWYGHMTGPCIRWPAPTHGDPEVHRHALPGLALKPWVTCGEALAHLPDEEMGRPVRIKVRPVNGKDGSDETRCSSPDAPARVIVASPTRKGGGILFPGKRGPGDRANPGTGALVQNKRHPDLPQSERPSDPGRPALTVNAKPPRQGEGNGLMAWPRARPSTTVYADERIMAPGHHDGSNLSAPNAISLSERAAAILQGFPPDWKFCGATKRARWSQIGQAVCPPLAEAIGRAVIEQMKRSA